MHFKFTTAHFQRFGERAEAIACLSNKLLEAEIATLPEVFSQGTSISEATWTDSLDFADRHKLRARLWGVEEIKQNKCEHYRVEIWPKTWNTMGTCIDCGDRLKWESV